MPRILVAAMPFAGHANPIASLAEELARRGHEVLAYTGAKYAGRFEAAGARIVPWRHAPDFDDARLSAAFPRAREARGLRALFANLRDVFLGTAAAQARDIADLAAATRPEAVVADMSCVGPGLWAQREGVPWGSVSLMPLAVANPWGPPPGIPLAVHDGAWAAVRNRALAAALAAGPGTALRALVNRARREAGLGPTPRQGLDSLYSPVLTLAQGVPELEYRRPEPVPGVEFIGHLVSAAQGEPPEWWGAWPDGTPVVHVTQGTLNTNPEELLRPAVAGLADGAAAAALGRPAAVVLVTCGAPPLGPLPPDAFETDFLPYGRVLADVDVVVGNGGYGTVLAALAAGVPLVLAGDAYDKPEIARRVAWAGAGIDLRTGRPTPARVRDAVGAVLADPAYRRRARELAVSMAAAGGAPRAADLVEERLLGWSARGPRRA